MSMTNERITIYEYKDKYWIIEESCQKWPDKEGPTEKVALAGSLNLDCSSKDMGELSLSALQSFNSKKPSFSPWELKELRKQICSWVGARAWPSFYKNSRYVWVVRDSSENYVKVIPVDNCVVNPYESPVANFTTKIEGDVTSEILGKHILDAFGHATSHPERNT